MVKIIIKRAGPAGVMKIPLTTLFRYEAGLTLPSAKQATDDILDGKIVTIEMKTLEDATSLAKKATDLGVVCSVVED